MKKLTKEKQAEMIGREWREISQDVREILLAEKNIFQQQEIDRNLTENSEIQEGDCIVDLTEYLSIAGYVNDDYEVVIDEGAKIYSPCGIED